MSTNFLRLNRPYSFGIFKYSFENLGLLSCAKVSKEPIYSLRSIKHSVNLNLIPQTTCRTFYSVSSVFQCIQHNVDTDIPTEPIHQTTASNTKFSKPTFEAKESAFYHSILEQKSAYSGTIYQDDPQFLETYKLGDNEYKEIIDIKTWNEKSPSDIIETFISLGIYASNKDNITIEDKQFVPLITALIENLKLSTDKQLIDCLVTLKFWPLLNNFKDPTVLEVWNELDEVCMQRYLDWTIDKCLLMMDLWYNLGLLKNSYFVFKGLTKISRKVEEFTPAQMIQALFYMSVKRKLPTAIAIREYEYYIQQYITKLSIEEIAIFSIAFFKTKMPILNKKILMYIMQRTVQEADSIDTITLAAIAKIVRFSHKPDIGFTANDMVSKLMERRWDSFSLITGIHLAHIGTQVHFYNEEVIIKLAEKFCKNPSEARLKDMERIAYFLSLYNYIPPSTPDIFHIIEEELQLPLRQQEAHFHPLVYLSLLYFISILRVFPEKNIEQILNEERLLLLCDNRFNIPEQAVQLDYNRVLEGPAGSRHLLPPQLREYLCRRYSIYIPDNSRPIKYDFEKLLFEVMELTNEFLGKENHLVTYTLPHFPRPDILFSLDENGKPLPIPDEMRKAPLFDDVHRPIGPGKWYCVVIASRNMYMHNVPRLVGEHNAKLRQLRAQGYTPILIPSFYWKKEEDKKAYLKLKYFSGLGENKK